MNSVITATQLDFFISFHLLDRNEVEGEDLEPLISLVWQTTLSQPIDPHGSRLPVYFLQSRPILLLFPLRLYATHHQSGQEDRPTQRGGCIYSTPPQLKRIYQSCQIPYRQTNTFLPLLLGWRFTKLVGIDDLI